MKNDSSQETVYTAALSPAGLLAFALTAVARAITAAVFAETILGLATAVLTGHDPSVISQLAVVAAAVAIALHRSAATLHAMIEDDAMITGNQAG